MTVFFIFSVSPWKQRGSHEGSDLSARRSFRFRRGWFHQLPQNGAAFTNFPRAPGAAERHATTWRQRWPRQHVAGEFQFTTAILSRGTKRSFFYPSHSCLWSWPTPKTKFTNFPWHESPVTPYLYVSSFKKSNVISGIEISLKYFIVYTRIVTQRRRRRALLFPSSSQLWMQVVSRWFVKC